MVPILDRDSNMPAASSRETLNGAPRPLVHGFHTLQNYYALDANTNRVVRLDSLTGSILDDFGSMEKESIVEKFGGKFGRAETSLAYDDLLALQKRDALFLPGRVALAALPAREYLCQVVEEQRAKFVLCLTTACNFKCAACPCAGRDHRDTANNLSWEMARKGIDDYIAHSHGSARKHRFFAFCGGEPLLNLGLLRRCVRYARERLQEGVSFDIITNGSLLSRAAAEFLAAEQFSMQVILDGPRHRHDHDRTFTNGAGTWETVVGNLRDCVARHPEYWSDGKLEICAHLSEKVDVVELDDFFCSQLPAMLHFHPYVWLSTRHCWDPCYLDITQVPRYPVMPRMEILRGQFLENARRGLINEDPDNPKWLIQRCLFETLIRCFMRRVIAPAKGPCLNGRSRLDATCTPTWFTYFMNVNGDYYLCERASPCEEFRIGNVRTGVDVDRCYAIKRKYVEMCDDQCRHCWCLNFCHVGCYTSLASEEGLTAVSKRAACNRYREAVHHMLTDLFGVLESNPHAFDYLKRKAGSRTTAGHDA